MNSDLTNSHRTIVSSKTSQR